MKAALPCPLPHSEGEKLPAPQQWAPDPSCLTGGVLLKLDLLTGGHVTQEILINALENALMDARREEAKFVNTKNHISFKLPKLSSQPDRDFAWK